MSHARDLGPGGIEWPGTVPWVCYWHQVYDCWRCRPRIAVEYLDRVYPRIKRR